MSIHSDEGGVGYGEIAPLPGFSVESLAETHAVARRCIESLKKRASIDPRVPAGLREREMFPASVRFGIECALWNLAARANNESPPRLFVARPSATVPVNALSIDHCDDVLSYAQGMKSLGFRAVKLKVGRGSMELESDRIDQLRAALGRDFEIRLDANRKWTFDEALRFVHKVSGYGISYIEEPIDQPEHLPEFAAQSPIPIAVDETLRDAGWENLFAWREDGLLERGSEAELRDSVRSQAGAWEREERENLLRAIHSARVWVVKPSLVGMPLKYTAMLLSKQCGIDADLAISSSFESGLGLVALANLAACAGEDALPAGLDTSTWLAGDVLDTRLPMENGAIDLAKANALVARFTPDALEVVSND